MISLFDEIAPGLPGLEQLRAMIASGRRPGMGESLDFTLVEADEGRAVFESVPGRQAYNPIGTVHGGYAATLLDSACGCAAHSRLTATQGYTTLELKVSFHRPITADTGLVRTEATLISFGRRAAFAQATLTDAAGRVYATATSTLLIFER
ncbi:PaaI family thioesterase [Cryobacterium tagatosivorans]|uniref:PaaI family thioesterase n=1 Tax=Cryobacterium tagatosivorans TaxID=1259199 RepID=A0A4R8UCG7_9MICO|nr:PaaI family thioesterase [Cryobacterium tagatosivorans]TFB46303.1 PaaI family thioesterase [Cryobacterium tagatosivorans]